MNKNVLILTALPFRKHGNQSLLRFTSMLVNNDINVIMYTSGDDATGQEALYQSNFIVYKFKSFSNNSISYFIDLLKRLKVVFNKKNEQVFSDLLSSNSWNKLPPYGAHSIKKAVLNWLEYCLLVIENFVIFTYILFFRTRMLQKIDIFIAYEINYSLATKMFSKFFRKPYINKFQGTILKACGRNKMHCKLFYPANYFGINKSDLCIMVNDGTDGEWYCKEKGLKNIFFEPHGVIDYLKNSNINIKKFEKIDFNKFVIFNNASPATWKRVDRCIRFLQHIDRNILERITVVTTYNGYGLSDLKALSKALNVDKNVVFINGLTQSECNYILRNSKIILSTNDISNLGNPVLEAVYYNIPVVSLNDGTTDVIFTEKKGAILVDLDHDFDKKLAQAIEKLFLNNNYYLSIKKEIMQNNNVKSLLEQQEKEFNKIKSYFNV